MRWEHSLDTLPRSLTASIPAKWKWLGVITHIDLEDLIVSLMHLHRVAIVCNCSSFDAARYDLEMSCAEESFATLTLLPLLKPLADISLHAP
jgi:hypothetical protein